MVIIVKADNKNVTFPTQFCLESISNKFVAINSREVSLKGKVYYCLVGYDAIHQSDILNIYKYLVVENNIYNVWIFEKIVYWFTKF